MGIFSGWSDADRELCFMLRSVWGCFDGPLVLAADMMRPFRG